MAIIIGETVQTIMTNHLYQFDKKVYRQVEGGPIGLEITGIIADVVMIWFDQLFLKKAEEAGYSVLLYKRYVDDINLVVSSMFPFVRGEASEVEAEMETAAAMKRIADDIIPGMIVLEVDTPALHHNNRLPILDIEVWVSGDSSVLHAFYKKSMSSEMVVTARFTSQSNALVCEGLNWQFDHFQSFWPFLEMTK